jgi:threonine/homoserine/homoserine lactone efflux protein
MPAYKNKLILKVNYMVEVFLQSMLIGYSGAIMPGSLLTYTLEKSMKSGTKAGVMISIGHSLLELVLVILIFLGIGKYLSALSAQLAIGIIGGIVLILFGVNMVKDMYLGKVNINFANERDDKFGNILIGGALISASNPFFIVWWAAVGLGLIMNAYNAFGLIGIILFYLGHIMADITWYVFISTLISKTRNFINFKIYKIIITCLGICLIGFGTSFLISSSKIIYHYF